MKTICVEFTKELFNYENEKLPEATHYVLRGPFWVGGAWRFDFYLLRFDSSAGKWFRYKTDCDDEYPDWYLLNSAKIISEAKAFASRAGEPE